MQQLLQHIKKDKHGDALVEKLAQRFSTTEDVSHWRNIAFCIGQLPFSDKGVKKLIDAHPAYKNALEDDETAGIILSIVAKVKKAATKPDSKELAEDLENKVLTIIAEWAEINGKAGAEEEGADAGGDGQTDGNGNANDENAIAIAKSPNASSPLKSPLRERLGEADDHEELIAAVKQLEVDSEPDAPTQ